MNGAVPPGGSRGPTLTCPRPSTRRSPTTSVVDRWILSRLAAVIAEVDSCSSSSSSARRARRCTTSPGTSSATGTWSSPRCRSAATMSRPRPPTRTVLGFVLDQMLRLLHPVMPFVTDELWTALTGEDSVMVAAWPAYALHDERGRGRDRLADAAGHRGQAVPLRPGAASGSASPRPAAPASRPPHSPRMRTSIRALLRLTVPADTGPEDAFTAARRCSPRASPWS